MSEAQAGSDKGLDQTLPPEGVEVLKVRGDPAPVRLKATQGAGGDTEFVAEGECSWAGGGKTVNQHALRQQIEPWLTALFQSEHLSLLVGSGLTQAVHRIATGKGCRGMSAADFGEFAPGVNGAAEQSARAADRPSANIEDQLRSAAELLRGLEILGITSPESAEKASALEGKLTKVLETFAADVLAGEQGLASAPAKARVEAFNYLVSFLMSFASRSGTRDRLHIFTTNYDRYLEAGAEAAGMHLLDRFVGSVAPIFRSSRLELDLHYNPPGIRGEPRYIEGVARFTKLHGSLDWIDCGRTIRRVAVPFGADALDRFLMCGLPSGASAASLMIYPNAAKDRETAAYPYVDLFRDLAAALCRPNHTLVTFGYGYGDDHINRVIEDMLTIPSTHLVAISRSDKLGRILGTYERLGRHAQTTLLIGEHLGDFCTVVDRYLPKPAIDRTTFRMAELLKARLGVRAADEPHGEHEGMSSPPGA